VPAQHVFFPFFYCIYLLIENLCLRNLSSSSSTSRCRNLSISLARIWGVCDLGWRVEGLGFSCRVRGLGISLYRLSTSPVYIAVYIACPNLGCVWFRVLGSGFIFRA